MPGTTIDRQCGSSQQAVHFAAQAVMSGTNDVVVAGGVQNMSMIPIASAMTAAQPLGFSDPFSGSSGWVARYGTQEVSQFRARRDDRREVGDHPRRHGGVRAREPPSAPSAPSDEGRFDARDRARSATSPRDEGPRRDTSLEKMATLQPLADGGRLTAAVSSQISDAAARAARRCPSAPCGTHGLTPRARIHHLSVRGADPIWMLTAPIPATALRAGARPG